MEYIMHKCSNHIQHEGKVRGLYVVTHECILLQTALLGWFVSYKPLVVPTGQCHDIALPMHRAIP